MVIQDIQPTEFSSFYSGYISKIPDNTNLIEGFEAGLNKILTFFKAVPKDKLHYKYADGKWTISEVFQHIIDTERVFMYRCFRIARHDRTALPGFEQDAYILPSDANSKSLENLCDQYEMTRRCFIMLLKSLNEDDLKFVGKASGYNMTARAAAFIVLGHELWHIDVIKKRYL